MNAMLPFRIVVVGAPVSAATKLTEDTMTYLNQGQAYEIKLENITDVEKKGFMCSIINIGFHERHMQQAEHELWQQWSQQHPDEKIFSVDMKLSYNVFGVESDGLNKCEFLWDSSKAAGVFIRINSISTEFTPRKHGGEKGVPFKLAIETFSYNSKTHDSYFISAACCQIKVFKPKGAERKIRSDKEKISKKPLSEQDKYHKPSDHTLLKECSLTSLHPMADGSLCYYRHSHGHFASKQSVTSLSLQAQANSSSQQDVEHNNNNGSNSGSGGGNNNNGARQDHEQSPEHHQHQHQHQRSGQSANGSETGPPESQPGARGPSGGHQHQHHQHQHHQQRGDSAGSHGYDQQQQFNSRASANHLSGGKLHHQQQQHLSDYSASRLMQTSATNHNNHNHSHHHHHYSRNNLEGQQADEQADEANQHTSQHNCPNGGPNEPQTGPGCFNSNELPLSLHHHHSHQAQQQPTATAFNHQMYHSSGQVRGVASLVGINNSAAHFGHLGSYYGHTLPNSIGPPPPPPPPPPGAYANNVAAAAHLTTIAAAQTHHQFPQTTMHHPPTQSPSIGGGGGVGASKGSCVASGASSVSCSSSSILRQFSQERQLSATTSHHHQTVNCVGSNSNGANNNNNQNNNHSHSSFLGHNSSASSSSSSAAPFKAANLALTHTHHTHHHQQNSASFYLGSHQAPDHHAHHSHHSCNQEDQGGSPHELAKEASSPENGAPSGGGPASGGGLSGYQQHENQYDLHLHHSSSSSSSQQQQQQQQPFRQRSASTSLTITNVHCSNYMSHGSTSANQNSRLFADAYGPTSSLFENSMSNTSMTTNHWMHATPILGASGLGSSSSICRTLANNGGGGCGSPDSAMAPHHHESHHNHNHNHHHSPFANGHGNGGGNSGSSNNNNNNNNNYDCSEHNYDSDQNSPQKNGNNHHHNHHHHGHNNNNNQSDSAASSYGSRFKSSNHHSSTNSLMACQETTEQQHHQFDSNSRMGSQHQHHQQQQHQHQQHLQHPQQCQQQQQQQQQQHGSSGSTHITVNSNCSEVAAWFEANRFDLYTKTFSNFSGSDLLRLSKTELIEICGLIDGIRLFNCLHSQPIKPGRIFYICHSDSDIFHPIYLYDVTLKELLRELSIVFNSHFLNCDQNNCDTDDSKQLSKGLRDKSALNSGSSDDSGSSMEDLSTDIGTDDVCDFYDDDGFQRRSSQRSSSRAKCATNNSQVQQQQVVSIDRLLIDGVTSVKIVATEQVVQMLENESVWTLSISFRSSGLVEACLAAQFKRNSK